MTRIIAGRAGGVRLATPANQNTRPTTDRVREAVFSTLMTWCGTVDAPVGEQLAGIAFLDLFAGSGAVGLEASSRGASSVVLLEKDARTAQLIKTNIAATGLSGTVVTADAEKWLTTSTVRGFDVIFLDPPYQVSTDAVSQLIHLLVDRGWLIADGLIVVERNSRSTEPAWPAELSQVWSRRYGETMIFYCRRPGGDPLP